MPKISIIIPVYNSSKYLSKCISSVVNQQIDDYEIILVDDKSTDNSIEILEKYKEKYREKIRILQNEKNLGSGASRNRGLDIANGDYIGFIDSDDYIEPNMYLNMYDRISQSNSDIAIIGLDLRYLNLKLGFLGRNVNLTKDIYYPIQDKNILFKARPSCCNKMFKRELIDNNRFPENLKWEDYPFTILMLGLSKKIISLNEKGYHYRINLLGTTCGDMKKLNSKILDIFEVSDILEKNFENNDIKEQFIKELRTTQIVNTLGRVRDLSFMNLEHDKKIALINALLNLIEVKYGDWQNNEWYKMQKEKSLFYCMRMNNIEKNYSKDYLRTDKDEEIIKEKIKKMIICK